MYDRVLSGAELQQLATDEPPATPAGLELR